MSFQAKSGPGGDVQQLVSAPLFDGDDMDFRLLSDYLFEEGPASTTKQSREGSGPGSKKSGNADAKGKKQKKGLARSVSVESSKSYRFV